MLLVKKKNKNNFEVAKIFDTFGYKGDVRLNLLSDFDRLKNGSKFYIIKDNKKIELTISNIKKASKFYIVSFLEVYDINSANNIKGYTLYTDDAPKLKDGEYHYQDLIGIDVILENNQKIGEVINIIFNPTQQILEISYNLKTIMIPFCDEFIKVCDDKIILSPIEGML